MHCMKKIQIWSFFDSFFLVFWLYVQIYSVSFCIQFEYTKIQKGIKVWANEEQGETKWCWTYIFFILRGKITKKGSKFNFRGFFHKNSE